MPQSPKITKDSPKGIGLKKISQLLQQLESPTFTPTELTLEEIELLREYLPETYEAVIPQEFRQVQESPLREAQLRSLGQVEQVAREGLPMVDLVAARQAQRALATERGRGDLALRSELAQRGRLGGTTEAALRQGAGQQQANLARDFGEQLTTQATGNRYRAMLDAGGLSGDIRGQDLAREAQNAEITNSYNRLVADIFNTQRQQEAGSRERAGFATTSEAQRVAEQNAAAQFAVRERNVQEETRLKQLAYENELQRLQGLISSRSPRKPGSEGPSSSELIGSGIGNIFWQGGGGEIGQGIGKAVS